MQKRTKILIAAGVLAAAGTGAGIAVASGDSEQPISGSALERASAEAVKAAGGGRVTDTEVGDEESYYEVEVTKDDGSAVDVQLDQDFNVVGQETDEPGEDDSEDTDEAGNE